MGETLEDRRWRKYNAMTHDELVEEMIKRDNTQDKTTLYNTAKEVSREELVKALQETIIERMKDPKLVDDVLIYHTNYGTVEVRDWVSDLFKASFTRDLIKEFEQDLGKYLKEHYKDICERTMYNIFLNGLTNNDVFRNSVSEIIWNYDRNNN